MASLQSEQKVTQQPLRQRQKCESRGFTYSPWNDGKCLEHLPYRFSDPSSEQCKDYLARNGFVVISNAIQPAEIAHAVNLFWEWIKRANIGWLRDNPRTWTNATFPGYTKTGVIYGKGIGQSAFQWFLRTHPAILAIFVNFWNVKSSTQLLSSFDGCGVYRPYPTTDTEQKDKEEATQKSKENQTEKEDTENHQTREQWFHVDQHHAEFPNFDVFQGMLSLKTQNEFSGGTVVIPKTHLVFKAATANIEGGFKRLPLDHWLLQGTDGKANAKDGNDRKETYEKLLVTMDAGDFLVWDGRTVHCNTFSLVSGNGNVDGNGKKEKCDFLRMVSYIAMSPKSKIEADAMDEYKKYRLECYRDFVTTGHWPHKRNTVDDPRKNKTDGCDDINAFQSLENDKNAMKKSLIGWDVNEPKWYANSMWVL